MRRVPNESAPGRGAEVLSVRALELLRASFLEVALMAAGRPPPTAPSSAASAPSSPPSSSSSSPVIAVDVAVDIVIAGRVVGGSYVLPLSLRLLP